MIRQATLAEASLARYAKTTRRAAFLAEMERVGPWSELHGLIAPFYPKPGNGRPAVGLERMLRIYLLQQWFNLSDPAVEEALYDSATMRTFVGVDLGREPVPDATTVCKFRHLLERHELGGRIFGLLQDHLQAAASRSAVAPSRRLSLRRRRPRTPPVPATRRCAIPRRAISGIAA